MSTPSADDGLGGHVRVADVDGPQHHLAVVDEQHVAGLHVAGQAGIRRADLHVVTHDVARRDGEALAGREGDRAGAEAARADLGALQVDEDADGPARGVTGLADAAVHLLVDQVLTMGEVQARHVHACVDKGSELLGGGGLGSDRADDLCASHGGNLMGRV
jgi:hypothetical protein